MDLYKIADLTVKMKCFGETLLKQGKAYRMDAVGPIDIIIQIKNEELKKNREKYPHLTANEWEYIQTGFVFSSALLEFDGFCLHASAVAHDNRAVLFSGPCGIGKSTHASLWQQHFGKDKAVIINDDKPALRLVEDNFYVYGTPWSGKSHLNTNIKVPLQAIVFIEQAEENHIRPLNNKEAAQMLIYQSLRPNSDRDKMSRLLTLLDTLLKKAPVYQMACTVSADAVKLAYETTNKERMK
ncbi:hypothetical protein [Clostridium formicaceticum]|uniref:SynChlorMet cassette protein ScmC n=1 Tax=Clostridium formicaceticum TaxID=1497 RepID=A0AAC9RK74_9CLOT|nr:hypothetical protein [Clostridium formicaceticum]AOY77995.1 hypothetical protein BJL90_20280 [Clostridium formicaceticum]ARE88624.1 hypothetical protein CLFO_30300 [Clostridium formicaceticum]